MTTITTTQATFNPTPRTRNACSFVRWPNCFESSIAKGVQPQPRGQLVNDLVDRVLDVQPEGPACLNELRYERRGGLPNHLAAVINPAPHGSRLRDCASGAALSLGCRRLVRRRRSRSRRRSLVGARPDLRLGCALGGTRTPNLLIRRYLSAVQGRPDRPASWHDRRPPVRTCSPGGGSRSPGWLPHWLPVGHLHQ